MNFPKEKAVVKDKIEQHKPLIKQLAKFGTSGVATVGADYATFALTYKVLGVSLFIATASSLLAGFLVSFTLNRQWVFNAKSADAEKRAVEQLVLYAVLFAFNTGAAFLFIETAQREWGLNPLLGKPITMAFITAWNFLIYKKFIFRLRQPTQDE